MSRWKARILAQTMQKMRKIQIKIMPEFSDLEAEFYAKEGKYEIMDPEKFYGETIDENGTPYWLKARQEQIKGRDDI
jgi:hypothetical protein